ncbi:MAG: hypothetical protein RL149_486 [Actinomycetota bacterium]
MANESWVGFAKSPKPDDSLQAVSVSREFDTTLSMVELFTLATSAEGMSGWLAKTLNSDVRTSGKVEFLIDGESKPALFSSVDLGKLAVLNSETFGEIIFKFRQGKSLSTVSISFSKLVEPSDKEGFLDKVISSLARFAEVLVR